LYEAQWKKKKPRGIDESFATKGISWKAWQGYGWSKAWGNFCT